MASYQDYLSGKIKITKENISKAVSSIAGAFNKRLKRIAQAGFEYQGEENPPYYGEDSIAGVKKFGAKGKDTEQLYAEFKRMKSFYSSEVSSLTGMRKFAREVGIEVERIKQYRQLKAEEERKQSPFEYVSYDGESQPESEAYSERSEQSENEEDSERSERQSKSEEPEFDFYGIFRGRHLYNYMLRNYGMKFTKWDSDRVLLAAEVIVANHWGELTMDEMAGMLYDQVLEMDVEWSNRRRRKRR